MKKLKCKIIKYYIITLLLFMIMTNLSASPAYYINTTIDYCYITNQYSNPLPINGTADWLTWRADNPFLERMDMGMSIESNVFFKENSRTGLSLNFHFGNSIWAKSTIPFGNFNEKWTYISKDSKEQQELAMTFAVGPSFKAKLNALDLGLQLRLSISSYSRDRSILLGLQTNPFLNVFISEHIYLTFSGLFDFHVMRFIDDQKRIYDENFSLVTTGIKIGCGFLFGNRG